MQASRLSGQRVHFMRYLLAQGIDVRVSEEVLHLARQLRDAQSRLDDTYESKVRYHNVYKALDERFRQIAPGLAFSARDGRFYIPQADGSFTEVPSL